MTILIAIATAAFFIYTAWYGSYPALVQRSILLGAAMCLVFLGRLQSIPADGVKNKALSLALYLAALCSVVTLGFIVVNFQAIAESSGFFGQTEVVLATIMIVTLLFATWLSFGPALPIIAICFLLYALFGREMPDILSHRGLKWSSLAAGNFLTTKGVLGVPLGVVADVVLYFLLFSSFLAATGASDTFVRLSQLMVGRMRGGPAKIAVVGSGLLGSISGSAVANVAASGTFTIPMMKRVGYSPKFAGAVEAVASSGSQLMPPVMGAAVFIMADMLQVGYGTIILAALFPAMIYYLNLFLIVDLEAGKRGLRGLDSFEKAKARELLKDSGYLLAPLAVLFGMVMMQYSPRYAALLSLALLLALNMLQSRHRLSFRAMVNALVDGMTSVAPVAVAVAVAGIVVGVVETTGLGLNLTTIMTQVAENSLLLLLILTMVSSIVLGMGLPTVACYIILALIIAPVMVRLGVPPLAAHMFVFYFGTLSAITPPVALASFTAAGIAGAAPLGTSFTSLQIALPAFLMPYIFVYQPGLLFQGDVLALIVPLFNAAIAVVGLSAATVGYFRGPVGLFRRALFLFGALMAFAPDHLTDLLGALLIALSIGIGEFKRRRSALSSATTL
ncbi:TRAP transporter permease [Salipiger aestuarii]|uniref:TRAP transporter permease n=1 Tax=Salipiger aestuarii TaxID=568098 RepID=UPI001680870D|nr:TRAP transporter fused permease subunit [Salipiger aestuarii]